ncbi:hypothetical protein GQ53DRAFT_751200 [Thozetella sp. PMI_491]|nr:hypothetical protein GQ53DRAFT_751200 [Thozetella sp. PMI_491]
MMTPGRSHAVPCSLHPVLGLSPPPPSRKRFPITGLHSPAVGLLWTDRPSSYSLGQAHPEAAAQYNPPWLAGWVTGLGDRRRRGAALQGTRPENTEGTHGEDVMHENGKAPRPGHRRDLTKGSVLRGTRLRALDLQAEALKRDTAWNGIPSAGLLTSASC